MNCRMGAIIKCRKEESKQDNEKTPGSMNLGFFR
jgi:hypothetical protein